MAKKMSDGYPLDIKGEMIVVGAIVAVGLGGYDPNGLTLILGFVSKVTKYHGIDVNFMWIEGKEVKSMLSRVKLTANVCIIDRESLRTKDPLHEAIRMAASNIGN